MRFFLLPPTTLLSPPGRATLLALLACFPALMGSPALAEEEAAATFDIQGFIVEGNHPVFNNEYRSPAIDWIEAYDLS